MNGKATISRQNLGSETVSGVLLTNPTEATAISHQNSPAIEWTGQGIGNGQPAQSQPVSFRAYVSQSGSSPYPGPNWVLEKSIGGDAFGNLISVFENGSMNVAGIIDCASLNIQATAPSQPSFQLGSVLWLTGTDAPPEVNLLPGSMYSRIAAGTAGGFYVRSNNSWVQVFDRHSPGAIGDGVSGPGTFTTLNAASLTATGAITTAGIVTGIGSGLTALPAGNLTGSINGISIGGATAAAGRFTRLTATGATALSPASANFTISPTGFGTVAISPASPGNINNMNIGATTPGTGKFTALTATGSVNFSPFSNSVTIAPTGSGSSMTIAPGAGVVISPTSGGVSISPGPGNAVTISPAGSLTLGATGSSTTTITSAYTGNVNNLYIGQTTRQTGAFTTLQAYDSFYGSTSTTDYRRAVFSWTGGDFFIETNASGSAVMGFNHLNLKTAPGKQIRFHGGSGALAVNIWNFDDGGHLVPAADNTYDIGAGGTIPGDVYAARGFVRRVLSLSPASPVVINFSGALGQAWPERGVNRRRFISKRECCLRARDRRAYPGRRLVAKPGLPRRMEIRWCQRPRFAGCEQDRAFDSAQLLQCGRRRGRQIRSRTLNHLPKIRRWQLPLRTRTRRALAVPH